MEIEGEKEKKHGEEKRAGLCLTNVSLTLPGRV